MRNSGRKCPYGVQRNAWNLVRLFTEPCSRSENYGRERIFRRRSGFEPVVPAKQDTDKIDLSP